MKTTLTVKYIFKGKKLLAEFFYYEFYTSGCLLVYFKLLPKNQNYIYLNGDSHFPANYFTNCIVSIQTK